MSREQGAGNDAITVDSAGRATYHTAHNRKSALSTSGEEQITGDTSDGSSGAGKDAQGSASVFGEVVEWLAG